LVVHVNTVGYRLSKIQAILGQDLRKSEVRLELQLALDVWDILRVETACSGAAGIPARVFGDS
jgi:DNA-binding PucR family transcriptional regulator